MDLAEGTHKLRSTIFCLYDCRLNNNNCPVNVVDIQIILIFFHIRGTELKTELNAHLNDFGTVYQQKEILITKRIENFFRPLKRPIKVFNGFGNQ